MLKINNLNKYYNRRKSNQIHVLNDIDLTFPQTGLVTILGASGSGKTTLLNVICGLDKVDSGSIDVAGYHLQRYQSGIWDKLRSEHFGYVFQNYNLFLDKTVFENVALSLRLLGIRDAGLIRERTLYTLGCVGMEKYKNRLAGGLSGGEQQRVAIARALVKDAKIIIADEPTGNLDEKNTVEIMNLIKKISQTRLVVLVTHERDMAAFYSDRIIEIKDGKITSDTEMTGNGQLSLSDEKNIYLSDLTSQTKDLGDEKKITAFNDAPENHYDIKMVIQGKNLYILASSKDLFVRYLDHDSEIKLIDAHRPVITKENLVLKDFDIQPLEFSGNRHKAKISFGQYFKMGLGKLFVLGRFKKLMLFGFGASAFLLAFAIGSVSKVFLIDESDFMNKDSHLVKVVDTADMNNDRKYEEALSYLKREEVKDVISSANRSYPISLEKFFLGSQRYFTPFASLEASVISLEKAGELDIVAGRMPVNDFEVVIDKMVFDSAIKKMDFINSGTNTYYSFLHQSIISGSNFDDPREIKFKIVGIANNHNASIYADGFYSRVLRLGANIYRKIDDVETSITSLGDNEILTNVNSPQKGSIGGTVTLSNNTFTIKGHFSSEDPYALYVVNENALRTFEMETSILSGQGVYLYSENIKETASGIRSENIEVTSAYEEGLRLYKRENLMVNTVLIFITGTVLAASLFYLYFLMRSSLISRITEIGIYRALGFTKGDIYVMFIAEIVAITSLTSIPGYIIASLMIAKLNSVSFIPLFKMNVLTVGAGFLIIFILNFLTGLLPVFMLLRKTPREIISQYDI